MTTPTYTPLANITLGSTAATVTFSSIPATYRDLVIVMNVISSTTAQVGPRIRFNSDSGSNYNHVRMLGTGSAAQSGSQSAATIGLITGSVTYTSARRFTALANIMDYAQTNKHKTWLTRGDDPGQEGTEANAGRWASTAAITSIQLSQSANSFGIGSAFALYGIIS